MEKKLEIYNVFLKQEFVRNMELLTTEEPLYPRDDGGFIDYESDRVSWWEIDDLTPDFRRKLLSLWKFLQNNSRRGIRRIQSLCGI